MLKTYTFKTEIEGDVLSGESYPIYDDECKKLLGGFTLDRAEVIYCFITGTDHVAALFVSTDASFYFTPKEDKNGKVSYGVISELPISPLSVLIKHAKELSYGKL